MDETDERKKIDKTLMQFHEIIEIKKNDFKKIKSATLMTERI